MPTDNPNYKARINNVTSPHPFTQKDIEAGEKIYDTHPARQASVAGSHDSAAYNAMQEFKNAQTNFGATAPDGTNYVNPNTKPSQSIGLPQSHVQTFGQGSYTNPQATTSSSANDDSSSINTYSFLDDAQRVADWKERNPDKNVFGFNKRNKESFDNRIKKAQDEGKVGKEQRLKNKKAAFENNQTNKAARRKKRGDRRAQRRTDNQAARSAQGATFLDKINPKNWAW